MGHKLAKIHRKIEKDAHKEKVERAEKFMEEYRTISRKYKIDWCAELQFSVKGVTPVLRLKDHVPDQEFGVKPWSVALRENLEIRKDCKHDIDEKTKNCSLCGVKSKDFGEENIGVTKEYENKIEAEIATAFEKEKNEAEKPQEEEKSEKEQSEEKK